MDFLNHGVIKEETRAKYTLVGEKSEKFSGTSMFFQMKRAAST
jgi:hypothetical protein